MRVLILVALIAGAIAVPRKAQRIMGGSGTTIQQYPFMANLKYGYSGVQFRQYCAGSLITRTSVLSSADCFSRTSLYEWRVVLGSTFASSGGTTHQVARTIIHEQFDARLLIHDVVIVKLATPAVYSTSVAAARIAGLDYNLPDGTPLTNLGWGSLQPAGSAAEQLQHVEVNQINKELCAERYAHLKEIDWLFEDWPDVTDGMMCAGILDIGGKGSCGGDSGGPLVHAGDVIVGIASWSYSCGEPMYPSVFVQVSKYASWIVRNEAS